MKTTIRIPQAPEEPLPELAAFLEPFRVHFTRSEGRYALDRYLTGLLTELPNKNCDTIAASIPGTSEQQLQGLLSTTAWDQDDLNRQRVEQMLRLPSEGDGVLIFDDTGFAKQGKCSVGVARQYSGTLGKKGNCQITVNCHYAERTVGWPVATRLYLPRHWAEDLCRRAKAHVPEEVSFQTKPQIALALLDQAKAWGDELLLGFSSRICYAFLERKLSFPEQRGPQVLTAPIPHVLRVTGREGVNNRLFGRLRQERSQRQDQPGESAPCMLLLQRLEFAEARFQYRSAARQPFLGAGLARFRSHEPDQFRRQTPAAGPQRPGQRGDQVPSRPPIKPPAVHEAHHRIHHRLPLRPLVQAVAQVQQPAEFLVQPLHAHPAQHLR